MAARIYPTRPGCSEWKRKVAAFAWMPLLLGLSPLPQVNAQTVSTVREAEFRSRWTDYQVDKAKAQETQEAGVEQEDFLTRFTQFGPLEFHGGLTSGYEYSNENYLNSEREDPSSSSLFLAPSLVAIYEKELGTWDLAARYSVGWLYYLDPNYTGSNGDITTSQTANISLLRDNERITIRSLTNASAGTGFDIERGQETDRVTIGESFSLEYQLAEYLRTGVSANVYYASYSSPNNQRNEFRTGLDTTDYGYAGAVFLDNFLTDKTAYRLELSTGGTSQESGQGQSNDRSYTQGVLRVNYGPTAKLAFTGSVGLGVRDESQSNNDSQNGLRSVFSLSSVYTPSDKTSVRLYVGVEGASSQPEFTLAINWHPREFTFSSFPSINRRVSTILQPPTNASRRGFWPASGSASSDESRPA